MEETIKQELEELQNLSEAERDENQQNRFKELNSLTEAEKTAGEKSKELQSALAQKEHFRTKFEEAEKTKKELEEKLKGAGGTSASVPQYSIQVAKLARALSNYNESEIEVILKFAKDETPEAIIEATKDDWVQTAIQAKRIKVAGEKKIPAPGASSPFSSTAKSSEDIAKMKFEEHRKYEEEQMKEDRSKGII